jgi:Fe-Mn family superoxide dismutase
MLRPLRPTWQLSAFEPYISTETMFVHVDKLHKGYVDKLNAKVPAHILSLAPSYVLGNISSFFSGEMQDFYRDMMGGNVAHTLLWKSITPLPQTKTHLPSIGMSADALRQKIVAEGLARFGSGWVWGALAPHRGFILYSTRNHDTPYMRGHIPVFCVDLWEHAYFLDQHGNRKAWLENICAFLDLDFIEDRARSLLSGQPDELDGWVLSQ